MHYDSFHLPGSVYLHKHRVAYLRDSRTAQPIFLIFPHSFSCTRDCESIFGSDGDAALYVPILVYEQKQHVLGQG